MATLELAKLHDSIDNSKQKMGRLCEERVSAVEQFVGTHYAENGAKDAVPVNLLELATTIYLRLLAARAPHCLVTTETRSLKPFAADMEIVLNQIPDEIKLSDTLRRAVLEAIFGMGIVKVGIAGIDPRPNFGDEPFVSLVTLDDYFVDMSARSWDEIQYEGNEYWMTVREVKDAYGIDVAPDEYTGTSKQGEKQANGITNYDASAQYEERVLLRDVYITHENRMVTYAPESMLILNDVSWDGPEGTPYIKLWFSDVPSNLLPLPPVAVWRDLHDFSNTLFRKIGNEAASRKTVVLMQGGSDEQAKRFCNAKDGEAIAYSGAKPEEVHVGGVDNAALALVLQSNDLMSRFAGNLDSLGGLSAQSATASQDKLLNEAASARVAAMSARTADFAKEIFERLAWYVWTDPVRVRKFRRVYSKILDIGEDKLWTPETRDGDFVDYNFSIDAFSMQDDSPAMRMQKLNETMQNFVYPMLQQLTEQGAIIDMQTLLDYIAKNSNQPILSEIVRFQEERPQPERDLGGSSEPSYVSTKAPVTKRIYERVNRPGKMTSQGRTAVMVQALMGQKSQPADMAGATGANLM